MMESGAGKIYSKTEVMSRDERKKYHDERLQEQVHYAYNHSIAMRHKLESVGAKPTEIQSVEDLERIPITTKDDLLKLQKEYPPWGGLLGVPLEKLGRIFMSPGPIYDPQPFFNEYYDNLQAAFHCFGFRETNLVVNTWNYHMMPAAHLFDAALRRMGCTVIPMGPGNTNLQVQVLSELPVRGWIGTAGFLVSILERAEELGHNVQQRFSIDAIFAGAEMGGGAIRELLKEKYGFVAFDMYALAEVGAVGYECHKQNGLHLSDLIVEIVDPASGKHVGPGEVGQVVVTNFDKTYPLVRFGTGDLSVLNEEDCPCGRTTARLSRIIGRVGDAVRVRGMFIHPRQVHDVMGRFPAVHKYQISVIRPEVRDQVVLRVECVAEDGSRGMLSEMIAREFQNTCRLRIDKVEYVPEGTILGGTQVLADERAFA
jgi:phenylacetate-CoA ligase